MTLHPHPITPIKTSGGIQRNAAKALALLEGSVILIFVGGGTISRYYLC